jgi:hypothetical protein
LQCGKCIQRFTQAESKFCLAIGLGEKLTEIVSTYLFDRNSVESSDLMMLGPKLKRVCLRPGIWNRSGILDFVILQPVTTRGQVSAQPAIPQ